MPRKRSTPPKRATQSDVDLLHQLTARALSKQLRTAEKAGEPVSAALLSSAIAFLKLTDTRTAEPPQNRPDRLARSLPSLAELDAGMRTPE
jgi:hypothetical protein